MSKRYAAIAASNAVVTDVLIATKLRLGDANTMMAEGGIQAADKENDSPVIHYLDVLGGGRFANHPELVEALVQDAPLVIAWLEKLGVMFDKTEDGTMRCYWVMPFSKSCRLTVHNLAGSPVTVTRGEVQYVTATGMLTLSDTFFTSSSADIFLICSSTPT